MPRPEDSGGPPHPHHERVLCVGFGHVKTLAIRNNLISKLYQHFRACPVLDTGVRGHPYGLQDALSTLRLSCSPLPRLRHRRKTRYGWVASPYPTGTFTQQDTPSFSWRDNDRVEGQTAFGPSPRTTSWASRYAASVRWTPLSIPRSGENK
jgi:hypothetical protein